MIGFLGLKIQTTGNGEGWLHVTTTYCDSAIGRGFSLRWHITSVSLLLNNVVLVCQGLLFLEALRHVAWMQVRYLRRNVATVLLLGIPIDERTWHIVLERTRKKGI